MKHGLLVVALAACGSTEADPLAPSGVDLAVSPRALERVPDGWPVIVATKNGIVVEGKAIASIANGDVDPADKEGGVLGVKITRLADYIKTLGELARTKGMPPLDAANVVIDQALPYRLAIEILYSAKTALIKRFGLVAKDPKGLGIVPLTLPDKSPSDKPKPGALKLVVGITKDKIVLWSTSGLEGTLKAPKLSAALGEADKLTPVLGEIVKRRFKGKRDAIDRQIIVMADGRIPMKYVMAVMFAIRTAADGSELFPDIQLSSGFE
jgi:biopolymer transport protein ExbD